MKVYKYRKDASRQVEGIIWHRPSILLGLRSAAHGRYMVPQNSVASNRLRAFARTYPPLHPDVLSSTHSRNGISNAAGSHTRITITSTYTQVPIDCLSTCRTICWLACMCVVARAHSAIPERTRQGPGGSSINSTSSWWSVTIV